MRIYELVVLGEVYGYFKSFEKAKEHLKEILRDKVYVDGFDDDEEDYQRICREIDEYGYTMDPEINIYTIMVNMED